MKLSFLTIFLLIITACGRSPTSRAPASFLNGTMEAAIISGTQKQIALNLCFELKTKNMLWRQHSLGKNISFQVSEQACNGSARGTETVSTILKGPLNSQAMVFDSQIGGSSVPYSSVTTDAHGDLIEICGLLSSGQSAWNNSNGVYFYFHQASSDGFDGFTKVTVDGLTGKANSETITEFDFNPVDNSLRGIESQITKRQICSSGTTALSSQTYLP